MRQMADDFALRCQISVVPLQQTADFRALTYAYRFPAPVDCSGGAVRSLKRSALTKIDKGLIGQVHFWNAALHYADRFANTVAFP